ncbi:MAG: transposase [Thermoplasmatales archaeon]|nr:transposase [Thermoplasmatales archaeon]
MGTKPILIACVESEIPLTLVVTPANQSDCTQFNTLYRSLPYTPRSVLGDAAYDTANG